jgi:hypothetical protein
MSLLFTKKLVQITIPTRLKTFKKLCAQARKGDIYLVFEEVCVASISWGISKFEDKCEPYGFVHYNPTNMREKVKTALPIGKIKEHITNNSVGIFFIAILDAYIEGTVTILIPKEQPG